MKYFWLLLIPFAGLSQQTSKKEQLQISIKTTQSIESKVQLYADLAWEYMMEENDSALVYSEKALTFSKKKNYKLGEAIALETTGLYYEIVEGDYEKASNYYFKGIAICEKNNLDYSKSIYHSLGVLFHTSDNYEKAKKYYNLAYTKAVTSKDLVLQKKCLINLGSINSSQQHFKEAEALMLKSLKINIREELNYSTYANLGNLKIRQKKYKEAIPFLVKATEQHPDNIDSEENLMYLINVKTALNDFTNIEPLIQRTIKFVSNTKALRMKSNITMSLSNYYKKSGDYKTALKYHADFLEMYVEIKEKQRDQTVYDLETKYQTEKKEKEIVHLKQEQDILNSKQRFNILIIYTITATFGMLLFFLWYRSVKRKTFFKQKLEIKNKENEITQLKLENEENKSKHYSNELSQFMKLMKAKNDQIKELQLKLNDFPEQLELESEFKEKIHHLYTTTILTDDDWKTFRSIFDQVHPKFIQSLSKHFPATSSGDLKMGAMLKLNLSNAEISSIFGISPESVRKNKYRFRKKLDFKTDETLQDFINQL